MSGKITIALAGLGSRGKDTYAQAVKKFPEKMEIVAIADIDPDKVKEVAEEFHIPQERCFVSAEDLIAQDKLADVMFITTQDQQHVRQAIPALRKDIICFLKSRYHRIWMSAENWLKSRKNATDRLLYVMCSDIHLSTLK